MGRSERNLLLWAGSDLPIRDNRLWHDFEIVFREPTLIADALALGHPRLDVDQFPDGILLELRLGFAFGVCLQRGKHCRLIELVTEMFRSDKLRSASGRPTPSETAWSLRTMA